LRALLTPVLWRYIEERIRPWLADRTVTPDG
jgi:hypothetical protein